MSLLVNMALLPEIKAKTDNLPADPASESGALAKDATVAKEATCAAIEAKTDNLPADPASQALTAGADQATDIQGQTDKLAGETPVNGSATEDWETAEADVVTIGTAGTKKKIHDLALSIHNLVGTVITVRLYKEINDVERKVYEQTFNATTDSPGLPIINGSWATHEAVRVTLQSNSATDNGKAVDYDCMLEEM